MKTATTELKTLLATGQFEMVEVYTFTLVGVATILRYTSLDIDILYNSHTFYANDLLLTRGKTIQSKGIEVDEMDLKISPKSDVTINGVDFIEAARIGMFDGATIKLERLFYSSWWGPNTIVNPVGSIIWFIGRISDIDPITRTEVNFKIKSYKELLNVQWPKNYYKAECGWQLYDDNCKLLASNFKSSLITVSAGIDNATMETNMTSKADGYYDLGYIEYQTGENAGIMRSIKTYLQTNGKFIITPPLPNIPAISDTFYAYPGCDRTQDTCASAKFNNLAHFRGQPYVPSPETAT